MTERPYRRLLNAVSRLRSRVADTYWEWRVGPGEPLTPERSTRLLARMDQALAANRDKNRMIVCNDPTCQPYGEHYQRLHGPDANDQQVSS